MQIQQLNDCLRKSVYPLETLDTLRNKPATEKFSTIALETLTLTAAQTKQNFSTEHIHGKVNLRKTNGTRRATGGFGGVRRSDDPQLEAA